jgi:hypothetical protein
MLPVYVATKPLHATRPSSSRTRLLFSSASVVSAPTHSSSSKGEQSRPMLFQYKGSRHKVTKP